MARDQPHISQECPRCGQAPETLAHRYWACPHAREIASETVQATEALADEALAALQDRANESLWLRGIPPAGRVDVPPVYQRHWEWMNLDGPAPPAW